MDESNPDLGLDSEGICKGCRDHDLQVERYRGRSLPEILGKIRMDPEYKPGKSTVLGLSGGADSSYVYHLVRASGIEPYLIHFDNGYDTEVSTRNIRRLVDKWGDKCVSYKVDLNLFDRVQRAFFMAGTKDMEVPTDHAIKALLIRSADTLGSRIIFSGDNYATESHAVPGWTHGHRDYRYIESVCKSQGVDPSRLPHYGIVDNVRSTLRYPFVAPLNFIRYNRDDAISILGAYYGWEPYGEKHTESIITRFVHGFIIPARWGIDTRRSRYSAMVASNQLSRTEALERLSRLSYSPEVLERDRAFVLWRWGMSDFEFNEAMEGPRRGFGDFESYESNPLYLPLRAILKYGRRSVV